MKLVRFIPCSSRSPETGQYGILKPGRSGDTIVPIQGDPLGEFTIRETSLNMSTVSLLAPVLPSKIVAVGVNYPAHAAEFKKSPPKEPLIFLKPSTAVIGPGQEIQVPGESTRVDLEGELAVVLKKTIKRMASHEVKGAILGYTCFNDVTARDLQKRDGQWTRAKGFDTFAPIGPCIETDLDPSDLGIKSLLNGKIKQAARTSEMLFDVYTLISFISHIMTLLPGDVIATGTPAGVSPIRRGDRVEIVIEGIGALHNNVV